MKKLILFAILTAPFGTAYRFARAWDGEKMIPNASFVVDGDRLKSIGDKLDSQAASYRYVEIHTHPRHDRRPHTHDLQWTARKLTLPDAARPRLSVVNNARKR